MKGKIVPIKRHPLAIAWDYWLASDEGQKAADISTLPQTPTSALYLANRLRTAFIEGSKVRDVLCGKCGKRYVGPWEEEQHEADCR